ncbi:MAG: cytochrome c3 family protein [Oceanidesulfovibrio sp.]
MKRIVRPLVLIIIGVLIALPLLGATYEAMVVTSTPAFCGSCHEIKPAVDAWRASSHVNNKRGLVATCMDCHLPPPENTFEFFTMKTYHGLKDVFFHVLEGTEGYDKAEAREGMYESLDNETCMTCHENVMFMPHDRGAMLAHRSVINPRPGAPQRKCIDCHYDLVHTEKRVVEYPQMRELPYRAKGLRTLQNVGSGT